MLTVRDLMCSDVRTVRRDQPVSAVDDLMLDGRFRHVPVVDADGGLIGLLTDGDLSRIAGAAPRDQRHAIFDALVVGHVMTCPVDAIAPTESAREAAERMLETKFGCLPVVDDGRLIGILTEFDFVRYVAAQG
jgi:CBS domain-containing membrane protein